MFINISIVAISLLWRNWTCKLALLLMPDTSDVWVSMWSPNDRQTENTQSWLEIWLHNLVSCPMGKAYRRHSRTQEVISTYMQTERKSHSQKRVKGYPLRLQERTSAWELWSTFLLTSYSGQVTLPTSELVALFFTIKYITQKRI